MHERYVTPNGLARRVGLCWLVLPLLLAGGACRDEGVRESWRPPSSVHGVPADSLRSAIAERLNGGKRPVALNDLQWRRLRLLYESYGYQPLFLERRGTGKRVHTLVSTLATLHEQGMDRERYPLEEMQEAMRVARDRRAGAGRLAEADIVFSAAYFGLADDLLTGQVEPRSVSPDWRIEPRGDEVDSVITRTVRLEPLDRALEQLRPGSAGYGDLQRELERYRELVAGGGWQPVPGGPTLSPGDTADVERLAALLERLKVEGYLDRRVPLATIATDSGARAIYDAALAGGVAEFQRRHAIVVDSILGPGTTASLNVSAEYRLGQIAGNLERYRWLPRELGSRYVFVNVPAFRLEAVDGGERVLEMRVIVGAEYHNRATPAFSDSMSFVEFAPYWNVPDNIAEVEIWPKADADPDYLARNNYELWMDEAGETRVRQRPGRNNALGRVKFMFPNEYNVYLHDTPAQELFERDIRAFSYGCIRVEKPAELAEFVLAGQSEWDGAAIRRAMEGENRRVNLDRKLSVYIVYFTSYVRDGDLHFGNDVYDRDELLVQALARAALPSEESERLVAALRGEVGGRFSRLLAAAGF